MNALRHFNNDRSSIHLCLPWLCDGSNDGGNRQPRIYVHVGRRFYVGWFESGWLDSTQVEPLDARERD